MSFSDLGLRADLLQGIEALGFETPTPIQESVIPVAIGSEMDIMALAQTGTGKTAAFGLPLLQNLDSDLRIVQALVLCPTRELCIQVAKDLASYSKFASKTKVVPVYGGSSIGKQIKDIRAGAQVIVATPGRLIDLLRRNELQLDKLDVVVMDEADEMLNMGFRDDLEVILDVLPDDHTTWLFSATMSREINNIAKTYMTNPTTIGQQAANKSNENIDHGYYVCRSSERYETLKRVLDANPGIFGLIFCQTKREVQGLAEDLMKVGYNADAIHGDLSQNDRDRVMNRFRSGSLDLLVATDVAARGIDVNNITHVINFGFPYDLEAYTHRSGRTGRAGKKGTALSIVTKKFEPMVHRAGRRIETKILRREIPKKSEIMESQLKRFLEKLKNAKPKAGEFAEMMPVIMEAVADIEKEQLVMLLASRELGDMLGFYEGKDDIFDGQRKDRRTERRSNPNSNTTRIFINLGRIDGFDSKGLAKSITGNLEIPETAIEEVDLSKNFSHLEVANEFAEKVMKGMDGATIDGRMIRANEATEPGRGNSRGRGGYGGGGRGGRYSGGGGNRRRSGGGDRDRRGGGGDRDRRGGGGDRRKTYAY